MAELEQQTFRVTKVEGAFQSDLGELSGLEVYALVGQRLGEEFAKELFAQLESRDSASVQYKNGFDQESRFEIERVKV